MDPCWVVSFEFCSKDTGRPKAFSQQLGRGKAFQYYAAIEAAHEKRNITDNF
jgi:hypothetical protein